MSIHVFLLIDALIILGACLWTQCVTSKANKVISKNSQITSSKGLTGAQAARAILQQNNVNCTVSTTDGEIANSYDANAKMLTLSPDVYNGTSVSDIGTACLEAGHAIQYAQSYLPAKICAMVNPFLTNYFLISSFICIAGICGIVCEFVWAAPVAYVGLGMMLTIVLCRLMAFIADADAGKRVRAPLAHTQMLTGEEASGTDNILRARLTSNAMSLIMLSLNWLSILLLTIIGA